MSLLRYVASEVTRSYMLENDEERYTTRREKMYTFMRIPRELEKFMSYGFFHCLDSFLFIFTFLPLRVLLACITLFFRLPLVYLGVITSPGGRLFYPAEIIDLLKCFIIGSCCYAMSYVDTSMLYHMIKSQSVIKLYLMYNMIEVADRLFSAFGQDTIDALFWTATEPRGKKREHIGVIPHVLLAVGYVFLHSMLVLLQATTLNVAINASNKALLTIMMSNNFVELKGSVFKKFDKNNLFQVSCSDVRERFHLFALLFVVVVQTMKEYGWREDSFWTLAPDCLLVLGAEILVDWLKHAFITRFNEVPADVYKDYTISLAYDLAQTKQKYSYSDHSDIVSRRMGFIPLPLGVVMLRVVYTSVKSTNPGAWAVVGMAYLCLLTFRILGSIVILGKACDLIDEHQGKKEETKRPTTVNIDPIPTTGSSPARQKEVVVPPTGNDSHVQISKPEVTTTSIPSTPASASPTASKNLFRLPSDPDASRVLLHRNSCVSENTDVIMTRMNSVMEHERISEEEEGRDGGRSSSHSNRCRYCNGCEPIRQIEPNVFPKTVQGTEQVLSSEAAASVASSVIENLSHSVTKNVTHNVIKDVTHSVTKSLTHTTSSRDINNTFSSENALAANKDVIPNAIIGDRDNVILERTLERDTIENVTIENKSSLVNGELGQVSVPPLVDHDQTKEIRLQVSSKSEPLLKDSLEIFSGKRSDETEELVANVAAITSSSESLHTNVSGDAIKNPLEDEEELLRYRSVQRSMSSPDLVLDGLTEWEEGRRERPSGPGTEE